jgi:hypothetical protein
LKPDPKRVALAHLKSKGIKKTAGEVIFRKDMSNDASSWAFGAGGASERKLVQDFNYSPKNLKPLAAVLRSTLGALGHTLSAYQTFAKMKSARISPDGNLGGKGYIMKISDMRRQYMNCVEALSALSDTLYDETNAPHWSAISRQEDPEDRLEVQEMIQDAEQIRQDPQQWAEEQIEEEFDESPKGRGKTASLVKAVAKQWVDQIPGGLSDKKQPSDFDAEQLAKGIKVELEHTDNVLIAIEIAMDHLSEDSKYYDKLEKIEGGRNH